MSDLIERLKKARNYMGPLVGYGLIEDNKAAVDEAIAALSVAPAPVAAQYPTAAELVQIGRKAKEAHPNDPEQMFYASMRMACDWQSARGVVLPSGKLLPDIESWIDENRSEGAEQSDYFGRLLEFTEYDVRQLAAQYERVLAAFTKEGPP